MSKSLQRRSKWIRFLVYIICITLLIHWLSPTTKKNSKQLPWYTSTHPDMSALQLNEHWKTSLSTKERDLLTETMVKKARILVAKEFPNIQGIPGSAAIDTHLKAKQFRSHVDCWTTGEWTKVDKPDYVMPHFQDPIYGKCTKKYNNSLTPAAKYVWKSTDSRCPQTPHIEPANWCKALNGRNILLVGDLVHYQLHEVLLDTLRDGPAICFGELNCKGKQGRTQQKPYLKQFYVYTLDHTVCSDSESKIRYLRNDILSLRRKMDQKHGDPRGDLIEWPFVVGGLLKRFQILLLNRAPVLESDEEFIQGLMGTLKTIRKQNPESLVIYRSTGIGHPFCDEAAGPLEQRLTDDEMKKLPHGWSELNRRNAIARELIEGAGGVFVDLAALSDVRPDGHIGGQDCLRYCIPGPLTGWAQILYQVFLGLEDYGGTVFKLKEEVDARNNVPLL